MYELLALVIVALAGLAGLFFQNWLHIKERKSLLRMIMAKNLEQHEYYETMFKKEVKEVENLRSEARDERNVDKEIKDELDLEYKQEKKFLNQLEEDFPEDEVDLEKLRERLRKDKK